MSGEIETQRSDGEPSDPDADGVYICKYFSVCEFFAQPDLPGTTEAALKHLYCFSKERWAGCQRLVHYQQTGEDPPRNLLPSGRLMPM